LRAAASPFRPDHLLVLLHGAHGGLTVEVGLSHADRLRGDSDELIVGNPRDRLLKVVTIGLEVGNALGGIGGGVRTHTALLLILLANVDAEVLELGLGVLADDLTIVDLVAGEDKEGTLCLMAHERVLLNLTVVDRNERTAVALRLDGAAGSIALETVVEDAVSSSEGVELAGEARHGVNIMNAEGGVGCTSCYMHSE